MSVWLDGQVRATFVDVHVSDTTSADTVDRPAMRQRRRQATTNYCRWRDQQYNDDDVAMATTFHCSAATIFGLQTVDCTARNISSVKQLRLDRRHDHVKLLRLADNRLHRLGPDEFGRLVPQLQQLYLARNFIADVDQHTFRNLRTLQVGVL